MVADPGSSQSQIIIQVGELVGAMAASNKYSQHASTVPELLDRSARLIGNRPSDLHPLDCTSPRSVVARRGLTAIVGGGSRGIGYAIAIRLARAGARVAVLSRSSGAVTYGPGTIEGTVDDITKAGGIGLAVQCDLTDVEAIAAAVAKVTQTFGPIDVVVNNTSAHFESPTAELTEKRFDTMYAVGPRATYLLTAACLPHMRKGCNPHVLTIGPAAQFHPEYLANPSVAYSVAKMTMTVIAASFAAAEPAVAQNVL